MSEIDAPHRTAPADSPPEDTTCWCLDLPRVGDRAITDAERTRLRREARSSTGRGCALLLGAPLALIPGVAACVWAVQRTAHLGELATDLACVLTLAFPAMLLLSSRDRLNRGAALRRDLRAGKAIVFQRDASDNSLHASRIEALPVSGRVLTVDGTQPSGVRRVEFTESARVPGYASTAAEWVLPEPGDDSGYLFNDRELSRPERIELRKHLRGLIWSKFWIFLGFNLILLAGIAGSLYDRTWKPEPGAYLLCAVVILGDYGLLKRWRFARLVSWDWRIGRVVIVQAPAPEDDGQAPSVTEFLPVSRLIWTVNGLPAAWRKVRLTSPPEA